MDEIFERMERVMKQQGYSRGKMAEVLGVSNASISYLVKGRNKPGLDSVKRFIEQFPEIDPYWVLTGKGTDKKNTVSKNSEEFKGLSDEDLQKIILVYKDDSFVILKPKK